MTDTNRLVYSQKNITLYGATAHLSVIIGDMEKQQNNKEKLKNLSKECHFFTSSFLNFNLQYGIPNPHK